MFIIAFIFQIHQQITDKMSDNIKTEVINEEDEVTATLEEESIEQADASRNNFCGVLHGGRPDDEEPHVKKTLKRFGVKIDLILRVDLVIPIDSSVLIEILYFTNQWEFQKMTLMTCRVYFR